MRIVSVDPGKACGIALLDSEEHLCVANEVEIDAIEAYLDVYHLEAPLGAVIVERWVLYPWMAKKLGFHSMPASEAIGICRSWTNRHHVKLERQMASVIKQYKDYVKNQTNLKGHRLDAVAHGVAWMKRKGIIVFDRGTWSILALETLEPVDIDLDWEKMEGIEDAEKGCVGTL